MLRRFIGIVMIVSCLNQAHAAPSDDFVIVVKTDNPGSSSDTEFIIPTSNSTSGYNYNIDCNNDGVLEAIAQTDNYTCDYSALGGAGIYTIRIKDNSSTRKGFPRIVFGNSPDRLKVTSLVQWGTGVWESMERAFEDVSNIAINADDIPDLSEVTSLRSMFNDAILANPDTSNWNTETITDMSFIFSGATLANPDTSNWNTAAVTRMALMFNGATSANPNTSIWDTSKVVSMAGMFSGATSANPDTSGWNTVAVINMEQMFRDATFANPDTSSWDTSAVTNMVGMFSGAISADPDTSSWNTSAVTNMLLMFNGAATANPDTSSWNTAAVTDMTLMFRNATSANPDTSNWNISSVTNMRDMFFGVTLPPDAYDALLIGFAGQSVRNGVDFHGGDSRICSNAAQAAKDMLIDSSDWNITDGGLCAALDDVFGDSFEAPL